MAYIAPNSTVILCRDVPLVGDYRHTVDFKTKNQQEIGIRGYAKHTLANQSYVRVNNSQIKVELVADSCYDCNYLMFQNTSFGNKWFYAFITAIEYINNSVTLITFSIDVMQTYMFDYTLQRSYVERQHSPTDNVGDNLVPDNVPIGDIIRSPVNRTERFDPMTHMGILIVKADDNGEIPVSLGGPSGLIAGLFTGLQYCMFDLGEVGDLERAIEYLDAVSAYGQTEMVTSVTMVPTFLFTTADDPVEEHFFVPKYQEDIGGYQPRNKKLLTYPFNYLRVSTSDGAVQTYRYEWFRGKNYCDFMITGALAANPEILCIPEDYNNTNWDYENSLCCTGYPQCAYTVDAYKAWLAQRGADDVLSGISAIGGGLANAMAGNIGGAISSMMGLASNINEDMKARNRPNTARGSSGNSTLVALREKDFFFENWHVTVEQAKILDDYYDKYGYPYYRLMIPNTTSRNVWNYVKTQECTATGSVPYSDLLTICGAYDKGITFWHSLGNVGRYDLRNLPTGTGV